MQSQYKILTLKPNREKSVLNKHPWLFSGAIDVKPNQKISNGEIVAINSSKGERLGYGFYTTESQIVCKMFEFTNVNFDNFDTVFWKEKIETAFYKRKQFINTETTNTYRLIHAEGDFLPGLIADVYGDLLVLQLLTKGVSLMGETLKTIFQELGFQFIYVKVKASTQNIEKDDASSYWLTSPRELKVVVKENNVLFNIDIEKGQKTGFFIDQRNNRAIVEQFSRNKKVLNCFSYNGGFSLYALKGQATEVISVDISEHAIQESRENAVLNGFESKHTGIAADCFDYLRKIEKDHYDVIILDPPAFAKNARAVQKAAQGYKDINLQAMKNIKKGGLLFTFSCSQHIDFVLFQQIMFAAAADANRNVQIVKRLEQCEDHPISIFHPEGEYLKGFMLLVD